MGPASFGTKNLKNMVSSGENQSCVEINEPILYIPTCRLYNTPPHPHDLPMLFLNITSTRLFLLLNGHGAWSDDVLEIIVELPVRQTWELSVSTLKTFVVLTAATRLRPWHGPKHVHPSSKPWFTGHAWYKGAGIMERTKVNHSWVVIPSYPHKIIQ